LVFVLGITQMNANDEIPEGYRIAVEHRLAVMNTGKLIWFLIIALSIWGIFSSQYHLILVALISGWVAMWLLSIHAANNVEKLTGLSHQKQAEIWNTFKKGLKSLNDNNS